MKDRVFRFLVEEMGFTGFAIEATMPEAFAVDTYVRTGQGDPAKLLSHLYFWTWNTSEVADLIQWMRTYNQGKPADKQVGFYGFDMQYPGVAIDSVVSYVSRVAPGLAPEIAQDYACLDEYRNDTRGRSANDYGKAPADVLISCAAAVDKVYRTVVARRSVLEPASSPADYALALQMARVVVQWEGMKRNQVSRDAAMAENADWLLRNRALPNGRLFLWAHNFHISRAPAGNTMGAYLARTFKESYVPIGFTFGSGEYTAVVDGTLSSSSTLEPSIGSYEEVFQYSKNRNFFVNMSEVPVGDLADWFTGPKRMRTIGSVYLSAQPESFYYTAYPKAEFDVLIYVHSTTASRRLPFIY
jgi:erythromycin esterase